MTLSAKSEQKSHAFWLRVIYGMATANFLAVIQLISAPHFQTHWSGQFGMALMIANIPLSFGWAINNDLKTLETNYDFQFSRAIPAILSGMGIGGLILTIKSFNPLFGNVFFGAVTIAFAFIIIADMRRVKRKRRSN